MITSKPIIKKRLDRLQQQKKYNNIQHYLLTILVVISVLQKPFSHE